jgi:hypothetical protein
MLPKKVLHVATGLVFEGGFMHLDGCSKFTNITSMLVKTSAEKGQYVVTQCLFVLFAEFVKFVS